VVELFQHLLDIVELLLRLLDGALELVEADVVGLVASARLVLVGAKVLDLLARVLDFGEAESGGGAFEEVAEG
jgi:hypothetical protein